MDLESDSVQSDLDHDYITIHDGDDGRTYAWYYDGTFNEWIVDLEAGQEISKDKFLEVCKSARMIDSEEK